ncbi:phosphomannomutase/phosphoglucomutase [Agaribacterium sp. ZY112]|uniref:phosphomannomutase/phosphoglucomutase n=1 Tax=Agaribacterium sp. ZY112 TaxID=3233574 RepID=UPI0035244EA9
MKLSKAAPASDKDQKPKKSSEPERPSRRGIRIRILGLIIGLLTGLVVAVLVAWFIYQSQVVQEQQRQMQELAKVQAELAVSSLEDYFSSLQKKVEFVASQSLVRRALQEQDEHGLNSAKSLLQKQIPDLRYSNFLQVGEAAINDEHQPPIRYSELAMIRQAESGVTPAPEAVRVNNEWLLHFIVPVITEVKQLVAGEQHYEQYVDGIVWASVKIETLPALLQGELGQQGKFTLVQNFGPGSRVEVNSYGISDIDLTHKAVIDGTHWELEFASHSSHIQNTHVSYSFILLAVIGASLLSIIFFSLIGFVLGRQVELSINRKRMSQRMHGASASTSSNYIDPMYQTANILDVQVTEADEALLDMGDEEEPVATAKHTQTEEVELSLDDDVFELDDEQQAKFPAEVFRAYDIRGVAETQLTKEFVTALGQALGSEVLDLRENTILVARDARLTSPQITEWLVRGILSTGCHVLNIGTVPTPLLYFALATMDEFNCGVMVTASHNSAAYNGFKVVLNGVPRSGDDIQALRHRMLDASFLQGQGQENHHDIVSTYIDTIFSDVALAGEMTVVIDAGNGVAGKVAPQLFEELGCRVIPLYCDLDGNFPNHDPDPSVEKNLQDLVKEVKDSKADIGVALDGDGDRLTIVSPQGEIIWADRLLILFARDILSRSPGEDVVFDVKSSRHLNAEIAQAGGRPIMWKTGHSFMKQKMLETSAVVGAEYSGHIFIKDRWFGFDDGMYAAARLLELLSLQGEDVDEAFASVPKSLSTPELRIPMEEERKFKFIEQLQKEGDFADGRVTTIDGLRVEFEHGWALVRASNTGPELTMRFEADNEKQLHQLKALLVGELRKIDKNIEVDWNQ